MNSIRLCGVTTNNLANIDVELPIGKLTVVTGVSGSGKSSLAFDTLYAEGQRRFLESFSTYARQFLQQMDKPPLRSIENILPAVALRQRGATSHARSTVATVTELADHLQLLYTHLGTPFCPECGGRVRKHTESFVWQSLLERALDRKALVLAEVKPLGDESMAQLLSRLVEQGQRRFYVDEKWCKTAEQGQERKNQRPSKRRVCEIEEIDVDALLGARELPLLIDRLIVRAEGQNRAFEAIQSAYAWGMGSLQVVLLDELGSARETLLFRRAQHCESCGREYDEVQPALFDPNTTLGACPSCTGFGKTAGYELRKIVPQSSKTLAEGALAPLSNAARLKRFLDAVEKLEVPIERPWRELSAEQRQLVLHGKGRFKGLYGYFAQLEGKRQKVSARIQIARFRGYSECPDCGGARLCAQARHVLLHGKGVHELLQMSVAELEQHLEGIRSFSGSEYALGTLSAKAREEELQAVSLLFEELTLRLRYLREVGLDYLRLDRQTRTLSGGELQRMHLTASIGRALTDTLYVLDEPTAGLHARDSGRLAQALHGLRALGNTVVVVEHDVEIIRSADWAIELGPGAGELGGRVCFAGTVEALQQSDCATGRILAQRHKVRRYSARLPEPIDGEIRIRGARENNLDLSVAIPLRRLVCVTGVSGSGKSTLVERVLYRAWCARQGDASEEVGECDAIEGFDALEELIMVDQRAMVRSTRSNAATVTKAYDAIRELYASTPAAKEQGIGAQAFSFNVRGGRCERCEGTGKIQVEMQFMADLELGCDTCNGRRFNEATLGITYRGKSIDDVLRMTVTEALAFFEDQRPIVSRLRPLSEVGLGYLRLGQPSADMSGGELQRLKLASALSEARKERSRKPRLFIFDEPTVGLHLQDVMVLIDALRHLVEAGQSVLVVEHNIDFVAACDQVIDLGPEAAERGGRLVVQGTPEEVARCPESITGRFLAELLV
jgi:excinuclease ABC subunit A